MDTEDSPWGDVPSRSNSNVNLNSASERKDESTETSQTQKLSPDPTSISPKPSTGKGPRTAKKVAIPTTRLEPLDGSLDPLGPLGEPTAFKDEEHPPLPPSKEQALPTRKARQSQHDQPQNEVAPADSVQDHARDQNSLSAQSTGTLQHPLTSKTEQQRRQIHPSVSIEHAARPTFDITVGDPHKFGDLTSSHIVYQVRTKTTSKAYKQNEFTVSRRYRDFLWLYNSLHSNNPGVVVPPPPEKQAVGRFDTNFVESRRAALERMLNKTAAHPILHHDADLKIFLESDAFNVDVKHREHKEIGLGENKGMLSSLGIGNTTTSKFVEHDDWFHDRKLYLDALDNQLKGLLKSIDLVVAQRKALADAAGEFSASLHALASVELSASLSDPLASLSDLQLRIRELYDRQAQQDVLTLGITVDEYIRLIASIKMSFAQRQKSYFSWHNAEGELQKRKANQDKLLRSGRSQQDKLNQLQADVGDGERRCHQARLLFEDMGRLMRGELERFEREKVEDFKSGVETFLEGAIEAQKELIELWETFLMQFDADQDGEPFFKAVQNAQESIAETQQPGPQANSQQSQEEQERNSLGDEGGDEGGLRDAGVPPIADEVTNET